MRIKIITVIMCTAIFIAGCVSVTPNNIENKAFLSTKSNYASFISVNSVNRVNDIDKESKEIEKSFQNFNYKQFNELCMSISIPPDLLSKINSSDKVAFCSEDISGIDYNSFRLLFENSMISNLLSKNIYLLDRNQNSLYNIFNEKKNLAYKFKPIEETLVPIDIFPTIQYADKVLSYSIYNGGQMIQISSSGDYKRTMYIDVRLKLVEVSSSRILYSKNVEVNNTRSLSPEEIQLLEKIKFSIVELPLPLKSKNSESTLIENKKEVDRKSINLVFKKGANETKVEILDSYNSIVHIFTIPTLNNNQSMYQYEWDLKDQTGNIVPQGEYYIKTFNKSGVPIKTLRFML